MNEPYMNTQGYQLIEQYYSDGYRITEFLLDGTLNVTMIPWNIKPTDSIKTKMAKFEPLIGSFSAENLQQWYKDSNLK